MKIRELLSNVHRILVKQREEDRTTARRFNVFSAIAMSRNEMVHSRFLKNLLDPSGSHSQGDYFLRSFLSSVLEDTTEYRDLERTAIELEVPIEDGRLDILIKLPNGSLIAIENKVDSVEGDQQLNRYWRWLQKQPVQHVGGRFLVFLTPEGREPKSCEGETARKVKSVSYSDICDWLTPLKEELPHRLREVLDQYLDVWRPTMNDQLVEVLRAPGCIESALYLWDQLEILGNGPAREKFLNWVTQELETRVNAADHGRLWAASHSLNTKTNANVGIFWREAGLRDDARGQFSVLASFEKDGASCLIVGICRGAHKSKDKQRESDKEKELVLKLQKEWRRTSKESEWWAGYVRETEFLERSANEKELVSEYCSGRYEITTQVAEEVWKLFQACREELEALNRAYPYGSSTPNSQI